MGRKGNIISEDGRDDSRCYTGEDCTAAQDVVLSWKLPNSTVDREEHGNSLCVCHLRARLLRFPWFGLGIAASGWLGQLASRLVVCDFRASGNPTRLGLLPVISFVMSCSSCSGLCAGVFVACCFLFLSLEMRSFWWCVW